jgi:MFS family permease
VSVKLDVGALWRNSPVAVVAVAMVGVSNGAFGTLSAVYADRVGLGLTMLTLFASMPVLAGAFSQIPVGALSDRMDRRKVLLMIAVVALATDIAFITLRSTDPTINLILAGVFGAAIYAMYPVIIAHASDHAAEGTGIQTSGGLLMIYGIGAIIGPLVAGLLMSLSGNAGLFLTSAAAHVVMIGFTLLRIRVRAPVTGEEKGDFIAMPTGRASTPETKALATRVDPPVSQSGVDDM